MKMKFFEKTSCLPYTFFMHEMSAKQVLICEKCLQSFVLQKVSASFDFAQTFILQKVSA
jgi:hypothetical protein